MQFLWFETKITFASNWANPKFRRTLNQLILNPILASNPSMGMTLPSFSSSCSPLSSFWGLKMCGQRWWIWRLLQSLSKWLRRQRSWWKRTHLGLKWLRRQRSWWKRTHLGGGGQQLPELEVVVAAVYEVSVELGFEKIEGGATWELCT